ncbi:hypothetical protein BJY16_002907 [Actinoplanes octamycinicus]|uniref:Uncharacterized protein n=1 Tax=Actinoplanes octamycinicus TaxID=135948 RepID=A0A7W7GW87_9ACTN|nr:hypothetical protein [Actinoplanes octamycinicus]MBB4739448.1 hypothetical protein [Actinoplanes octamycinicus]GIE54633.1 hypothetical protein Aoc01nite_00350 [Actinoplanes octamycinicus]
MSTDIGVMPADGTELDRATVVALLGALLGDDPDFPGVADGEYLETELVGDRLTTDWRIHPGRSGISELVVSVWDNRPGQPAAPFRAELGRVVEVLQQVAAATGGRFLIADHDVTGAPTEQALDLIGQVVDLIEQVLGPIDQDPAPVRPATPTTAAAVPAELPDEEFLLRYLAAGRDRIARLRRDVAGLDLSRDSLVPLWGWAIDRLALRDPAAPLERVTPADGSAFQRPVAADLPLWYGRSARLAPHDWSDESLALIDAIAFYTAESLDAVLPGLSWQVARGAGQGGDDRHRAQPVLAGRGDPIAPIDAVLTLLEPVRHKIKAEPAGRVPTPEDLRTWFDETVAKRR